MRTYNLFTTDLRYSAPTLTLLTAKDEWQAIEYANANLEECELHNAVELRDGHRSIYLKLKERGDAVGIHAESLGADHRVRALRATLAFAQ